jgi:type IV secretory pathway TrbF-like protein
MATAYPAPDLNNARWSKWKGEQLGGLALVNTWLLMVVGLLAIVVVSLGFVVWGNTRALQSFRPIVVRINELGSAQAGYLQNLPYRPKAPEVKHFLSDFVTKYYTHKTERLADYYRSKYYLSRPLGVQSWEEDQQSQWVKKVLNGQLEQTEAQVRKVSLPNLENAPYEALVEFQRIVYANGTDQVIRTEDLTATIRFTFADQVDSRMIQYNPLGLTILDFHSDQAFH